MSRGGGSIVSLVLAVVSIAWSERARAQEAEPRLEVGVAGVLLLGKGEPANDMIGERLLVRWRIDGAWHIGLAFDSITFDYETPNRTLGLVSATVVDGTNDVQRISAFVERRYDMRRTWDPHWIVGVGAASIDAPSVSGARADGGTFDIATDADDEIHVFAGGGLRRALGSSWLFDAALTFEHHTTDYELVDRVSGARGSIGSQSAYGITLGISYRF
jgi:hypothetical protein